MTSQHPDDATETDFDDSVEIAEDAVLVDEEDFDDDIADDIAEDVTEDVTEDFDDDANADDDDDDDDDDEDDADEASEANATSGIVMTSLPITGDPRVDDALSRLTDLEGLPVHEHVEVFEDVRRRLQGTLSDLSGQ